MSDRKSKSEMFGEVLREIGVLIVVFFPFDQWITFHALTWKFTGGSIVVSVGFIAGGMWIERTRWR